MSNVLRWKPGLLIGMLAAVGMVMAVACGAAEEATPTPTSRPATPTPTSTPRPPTPTPTTAVPPTATPTLRPGVTPVVATPTPTTAVPPTPTPTKGPQPKRGGVMKERGTEDPTTFDSYTATSAAHAIHNRKMNANLVVNYAGQSFTPDAAESYEMSADGKVWTFKLRDNVRFHTGYKPAGTRDGTLMTATDVKYSLEMMMGLTDDITSGRVGWLKEYIDISRPDHGLVVVDNRTIEIHLVRPMGPLLSTLAMSFASIYPEGTTREMLRLRPYGAGPFKLKEFQRGSLWIYERNPDYYKPGLPYLDGFQHVNIGSDDVAESALLTNRIDVMKARPGPDNKRLLDNLVAQGKVRWAPYSDHCRPGGIYMNMYKPPFDDKRLRQAVNLAFDRKGFQVVGRVGWGHDALLLDTGGWGRSLEEIMQMPGWRQPKDADVAEAKRIMQELYPKGLDLKVPFRDGTRYAREAEFIAGDLRKIGINITLQAMQTAVLYPLFDAHNYEMALYTACTPTSTPEETFGSYFLTTGGRNWTGGGYSNPAFDAAYEDMAATLDFTERRRKALAMEDMILEDLPIASWGDSTVNRAHWWYVQNITSNQISFYMWDDAETVWRSDI